MVGAVRPRFLRRSLGGFTLLEVMIALAVLAIALSAIITGVSRYANNAAYLRDRTFAHWVAMNKIAEAQIAKEWPAIGDTKGTATMADGEWSWEVKVTKTEDADVRRMDVKVYEGQDKKSPLTVMVAYAGRIR